MPDDREVGHPGRVGDRIQAPVADDRPRLRCGRVVGDVDHRVQERVAEGVDVVLAARVEAVQVGDQQHRLDHARRDERPVLVDAGHASLAVDDGESGPPGAPRQIAGSVCDGGGAGEAVRQVAASVVATAGAAVWAARIEQRLVTRSVEAGQPPKTPSGQRDRRPQHHDVTADLLRQRARRRPERPVETGRERPGDARTSPLEVGRVERDDHDAGATERNRFDLRDLATDHEHLDDVRTGGGPDDRGAVARVPIGE